MAETRFGALRELRRDPTPIVDNAAKPVDKPELPTPTAISTPARQIGKSSNKTEFERLTVYVRKNTKKAAARKWEDATGKDMSDLVEHLLTQYLDA